MVHNNLPIFSIPQAATILLDGLTFLREKRNVSILAYIIMENHIHVIVKGEQLTLKIGSFKSYTARKIIDFMQNEGHTRWLHHLQYFGDLADKSKQSYKLWEDGFYPKQIIGDDMLLQKIEYVHNNPVNRGYVDKAEHWRYSSAQNYAGLKGLIDVDLF